MVWELHVVGGGPRGPTPAKGPSPKANRPNDLCPHAGSQACMHAQSINARQLVWCAMYWMVEEGACACSRTGPFAGRAGSKASKHLRKSKAEQGSTHAVGLCVHVYVCSSGGKRRKGAHKPFVTRQTIWVRGGGGGVDHHASHTRSQAERQSYIIRFNAQRKQATGAGSEDVCQSG